MTFEEAVRHILDKAGPHGLAYECLNFFMAQIDIRDRDSITDYSELAKDALYEWRQLA